MPPSIPRGVADYFGGPAHQRRQIEAQLRTLARAWAYSEIIPPVFEYAETLATEMGGQLAEDLYSFFDRDGRVLALRPDLTIPTARIVGSKLYDQPLPQRYFYATGCVPKEIHALKNPFTIFTRHAKAAASVEPYAKKCGRKTICL